jgi:hypothetical protein
VARQSQLINGKAFEFAVVIELQLCRQTPIRPGPEVETYRKAFESLTPEFSDDLVRAAKKAVDQSPERHSCGVTKI